jgi:hypothetical protein
LPPGAQMPSTCITASSEPAHDVTQDKMQAPWVKASAPELNHCCYPIGDPHTPGFRYCAAPVAQPGAMYCPDHKRRCHLRLD